MSNILAEFPTSVSLQRVTHRGVQCVICITMHWISPCFVEIKFKVKHMCISNKSFVLNQMLSQSQRSLSRCTAGGWCSSCCHSGWYIQKYFRGKRDCVSCVMCAKWRVSPIFFWTVQIMMIEEKSFSKKRLNKNLKYSGVQMSKNWKGCLIVMCWNVLTLSWKLGKEAFLFRMYSDFCSTIYSSRFMNLVVDNGGLKPWFRKLLENVYAALCSWFIWIYGDLPEYGEDVTPSV